jgi:pimeloyl-ACP methyl ester carboxylesterase
MTSHGIRATLVTKMSSAFRAGLAALLIAACSSESSRPSAATVASTASSTTSSTQILTSDPRFKDFTSCQDDRAKLPWVCTTLTVPIDRSDPKSATIPIRVWALPHSDTSTPAGVPLFLTPGGPGEEGLGNHGLFFMQKPFHAHHDIVAIDPRGTGRSAAIDCALQKGYTSLQQFYSLITACGQQLGANADRYGAADRILDLEDLRVSLGYDKIFYHGESAASTDVIAYAARFPQHLAAIVFDSGFVETTQDDAFSHFVAHEFLDVADGLCSDDPTCAADPTAPHDAITWLIDTVRSSPITQDGQTIDATRVAQLIDSDAVRTVTAARAAKAGNLQPLVALANQFPMWVSSDNGPASGFSQGAQFAALCNDAWTPWNKTDPPSARRPKYDAALAALPADYFAPWTVAEWIGYMPVEGCIGWPVPDRYEPVHPDGFKLTGVPTLILAGDRETDTEGARQLLDLFPDASFRIVHGAQHPALSAGDCAAAFEAQFLETLVAPVGNACTS